MVVEPKVKKAKKAAEEAAEEPKVKKEKKEKAASKDEPAAKKEPKKRKAEAAPKDEAEEDAGKGAANGSSKAAKGTGDVDVKTGPKSLDDFKLSEPVKSVLRSQGIDNLFPIQAMTLDFGLQG